MGENWATMNNQPTYYGDCYDCGQHLPFDKLTAVGSGRRDSETGYQDTILVCHLCESNYVECALKMENIKACPFCRRMARLIETTEPSNRGGYCVECHSCLSCGPVVFG